MSGVFACIRRRLEYIGARAALFALGLASPRAACRLASRLAAVAFRLLRGRRRIAESNLLAAGVASTPAEARRLALESFRSLALTVAESYVLHRAGPSLRIVRELPPATAACFSEPGRGVLLVSGHLGNWELGARDVARSKPVTAIARRMDNALVQRLVERTGMRGGVETLDKHMARPMELVRALRKGRVLALLTDQHARGANAPRIDFLGRPAATYATPALLQALTGAPIVFAYAVREGELAFREVFSEPLRFRYGRDSRDRDVERATQKLADMLGEAVRAYPGQYLWAHRRWKTVTTRRGAGAREGRTP